MAGSTNDDALHGSLRDFPLTPLLQSLARSARTGVLRLDSGSEVWLSDGQIYLAMTPTSPPLSTVIASSVSASAGEIEEMLVEIVGDRTVLERFAPEAHPALQQLLHEYNVAALFEMLIPDQASFVFEEGRRHRLGDDLARNSQTLLEQASHRLSIWSRIATRIPSTTTVFRLASSLPDGAWERMVSAEEWRLLALLDGTRTVAQVIAAHGASSFSVCAGLYRLLVQGVIEPVTQGATRRSSLMVRASAAGGSDKTEFGSVVDRSAIDIADRLTPIG